MGLYILVKVHSSSRPSLSLTHTQLFYAFLLG